ncbi:restriction endonuclease subunit S [Leuconostoc mesenteroides]|uniref:restriction endonuclease subunit S n=1 Tax=Leuconostoc mesenteroides TaxID=1245 RepID=UPI001CBF0B02|nr:restriction endonuclease subunit S [Leuconostoc mesenteroides]MBZ1516401.1 restriction endonuclease subunit S [Leuconostoc mesenteroides]MBZ1540903.1 restriction endonuclease subunit S [Leuconostoc mesenteroides]
MNKITPQIRFQGFTDDWEERKLGEIFNYEQPTKYIVKSTEYDDNFNTPVLTAGKSFLLGYTDEISGIKNATVENPVVIFDDFTTGSHYVDFPFKIKSSAMKLLSLNDNSDNFYFMFNTLKNIKYVPQSHERHWISKFSSFEIYKPSQEEQQKIGSFFKHLDDTIALHQRKLDLLKEQKKGFLQKMFPKNGAKIPELRFAGFADDWEERKLGEHAKYRRGSFPQPYGNKEWYDGEGAMPFVQVVDVTNKLTLVENTKQKISKLAQSKSVFVPKGTVVVTLQGSIGRVAITQYDSFVDRTLLIFEDYEKETNERFWAYTIQKKFEIEKLKAPGGTIKTITKEALSSFDVHLPQFKEQAKIGSFFKQLDDTIALHQRKLDLLKEQKKGFLQKMFVS